MKRSLLTQRERKIEKKLLKVTEELFDQIEQIPEIPLKKESCAISISTAFSTDLDYHNTYAGIKRKNDGCSLLGFGGPTYNILNNNIEIHLDSIRIEYSNITDYAQKIESCVENDDNEDSINSEYLDIIDQIFPHKDSDLHHTHMFFYIIKDTVSMIDYENVFYRITTGDTGTIYRITLSFKKKG